MLSPYICLDEPNVLTWLLVGQVGSNSVTAEINGGMGDTQKTPFPLPPLATSARVCRDRNPICENRENGGEIIVRTSGRLGRMPCAPTKTDGQKGTARYAYERKRLDLTLVPFPEGKGG